MNILRAASYQDFLSVAGHHKHELFVAGNEPLLKRYVAQKDLQSVHSPVVFLTDLTRKKYAYMHKGALHLSGYKAQTWIDGGLDFYFDIMDKTDFKIYNEQIFPEYIRFLSQYPADRYSNFIFSRNNRIKKADGSTAVLLQRFSFIADPTTGSPVALSGMGSDITHYCKDNSIIQTIEEIATDGHIASKNVLFKKIYFPDESYAALTKKEIEVVKWMSEGLSSKQIADKLKLSVHTVNNHRKNMLHKTNCKNMAELINYCMLMRFI